MPLACGYFKAMVDADPALSRELDVRIFNFSGADSTLAMAQRVFLGENGTPDVLACSVFGWNYNAFGMLGETFKQLRPAGWVIFGGTHVAKQGFKEDEEFVETLIRMSERHGFPRSFETSWAKHKSKTFYTIVERMKDAGLRSSFTLALQTLSDPALVLMKRKNMKLNDWRGLAAWLKAKA